jgi:hypothetical protein
VAGDEGRIGARAMPRKDVGGAHGSPFRVGATCRR